MDTDGTQCQICLRTPDLKLGFFCPTCARNVFYEPRFQSVQTLLSKEALAKEVAEAVEAIDISSSHIGSNTDHDSVTRLAVEKARSETAQAEARAATILEDSESLRRQIEKMRQDVMRKRSELGQHSKFMKSLDRKLGQDRGTSMYPLQKEIVSTQSSWNRLHRHTAEARVFLCREVAALYGLQQHKKRKGLPGRDLYLIGGVPIIDLRDLNGAHPEQVTTSVSRVAHLLHLASHYLGLRLPAEISLPTALQPYCHIHTPLSSYRSSASVSDVRSRSSETLSGPRQRVLRLDRPLHRFASEEPINYSLFIDAITLLAWDVAWIGKTQGHEIGEKHWEEICAVGKNMWNLFAAPPRTPALRATSAAKSNIPPQSSLPLQSTSSAVGGPAGSPKSEPQSIAAPLPGQYSHNSSHSLLSSSDPDGGADHLRGWRFANPVRIIDRIKSALLIERTGAEWEVLEKPESEEGDEGNAEPAEIPATKKAGRTLETLHEEQSLDSNVPENARPKKGWTRIRNPTDDAT